MKLTPYMKDNDKPVELGIEGMGEGLYIKRLTASQYEHYQKQLDNTDLPYTHRAAYNIALAICNEFGEPLMDVDSEEDIQEIKDLPFDTFNLIAQRVMQVNQWTEEGESQANENFPETQHSAGGTS